MYVCMNVCMNVCMYVPSTINNMVGWVEGGWIVVKNIHGVLIDDATIVSIVYSSLSYVVKKV